MNKTVFVLFAIFALACSEGVLSTITDVSKQITSLGPVLELFRRDTTSQMGQIQSQAGFNNLQAQAEFTTGSVRQIRLPDLFKIWVNTFPVEGNAKSKLLEFMQEAEFQEFIEPNQRQTQDFKFSDAKGKLYYMKVVLQQHPTMPDVIQWEKVLWTTNFQAAAPFVVVSKSKCNFFGCKNKDSVQYLQATLQPEHIAAIRNLAIPFVTINNNAGQTIYQAKQA